MRVIRVRDSREVAGFCGELLVDQIRSNPDIVLGLPTGGTPLGMYNHLVKEVREGALDVSRLTVFNLDEYVGLEPTHEQSYHAYMRRHLYDRVEGFDDSRLHVPDGNAGDLLAACRDYENKIDAAGGMDLAILGIGANGHIAFNEPGCSLASGVRVVRLSERTVMDNARFFAEPEDVPRHAMTQGVGTIRAAKAVLLMAVGEAKARAVAAALEGPVTSRCPASALQMHPRAVLVVDEEAASALQVRHQTRDEHARDPYASQFLFA